MIGRRSRLASVILAAATWALLAADSNAKTVDEGVMRVRAFDLPPSDFLSAETQTVLSRRKTELETVDKACPARYPPEGAEDVIAARRQCQATHLYAPLIARHRARYKVNIDPQIIGGVPTEIITPAEGVSGVNRQRVLINLHGGAFLYGGRWGGQVESIPIAALGKLKVVSVDYRMAPEHRFPAASEDVGKVYRELLRDYQPESIGIYGCSAGGLLTAEAVAWLQKEGLPRPGAVGMLCAAAAYWGEGDSGHYYAALADAPFTEVSSPRRNPYFKETDPDDPLAFPVRSAQVLAKFPASLLIASTRDLALSSVVLTHSRLVGLGVEADLHLWEGLDHGFFVEPDLPESREVYDVIVRFFSAHLAPAPQESSKAEIDQFMRADKASAPAPCQVLFVGSSSIVMWKTLAQDMAPLPVINRGLRGAQIADVNRWFDQVVAAYRPRAIVFYAGENDIAVGKSVDGVLADFDMFMQRKTAAMGQTPVYFISLKPSKLLFAQLEQQRQINEAIRTRAAQRVDLHYIDVAASMLQDGEPKELFIADNLHMNAQGYALWTQAVREELLPKTRADAQKCRQPARD